MGYLFLTISLLCGTAKGYCGKKISTFSNSFSDALSLNLLRMLLCTLMGLGLLLIQGKCGGLILDRRSALCALWSAAANSTFVIIWLMCARRDAYMLINVFLMFGVIVTVVGSAVIPALNEPISCGSIVGLLLLLFSVVLMQGYDRKLKSRKMSVKDFLLLCLVSLSNGLCDLSQKYYMKTAPAADATVFSFYTFAFSAMILLFIRVGYRKPGSVSAVDMRKKVLPNIIAMSFFLFGCSLFKTIASAQLASIHLYPLYQSASMLLAAIMSAVLLHEALEIYSIVSIVFALCGVVLIGMT